MNISEIIKEAHGNAIERGFYPEGEDKNIGELLMLIVSELGEALEAHRCGRFAQDHIFVHTEYYDKYIKNTFEDEIADVFIRLFDLCGYLEIEPKQDIRVGIDSSDNVGEFLLIITQLISIYKDRYLSDSMVVSLTKGFYMSEILLYLGELCRTFDIPIEKHINAKMAYNRTRPHKHGKEY